jgi:hypothetical protein
MNKKSQSKIGIVFMAIMFVIVLSMGLGNVLSEQGSFGVENNDLNGFEAFILDNILIIVVGVFIFALFIYLNYST